MALGAGVLILILILLGIRGCLDARKERSFENYASDLSSIITQANQLSQGFFQRLQEEPDKKGAPLDAAIAADRGALEGLLQRVENLDTPDELKDAESDMIAAFKLRRDALAGIAEQIPTALGTSGRFDALSAIASDMKMLLASDVLFSRAQGSTQSTLDDEGIDAKIEDSVFLPEPVDQWLDVNQLAVTLAPFAATANNVSGIHGLEVIGAKIDKTTLTIDSENTVNLNGTPTLEVQVQNDSADSDEVDVSVSYTLSGAAGASTGETTIPRLAAGAIGTGTIAFEQEPPTGVPLTLEVSVLPVPGEGLFENNSATYTVTFQ